jgi:inorganic pyrophosphatase
LHSLQSKPACGRVQAGFSVVIFVLLASEDGFSREWVVDEQGIARAPSLYNGAFSTIAFLLGAVTSIASGYLGACPMCSMV